MKVKAIINPEAGRKMAQEDALLVLDRLAKEGAIKEYTVFYTHDRNEAFFETSKLKANEYDLILAVGGDGTLNEIVNGIIHSGSNIPLSILPAGTGNEIASMLQYPTDIYEYCQMIKSWQVRSIDVGKAGERYFINVLIGGLLADIAHRVPQELKNVFGKIAYYITGFADVPTHLSECFHIAFEANGSTIEEEAILFVVTNSTSAGGFRKISPLASMDDGLFDVCIIRKVSSIDKLFNMVRLLLLGEHLNDPQIAYFQTSKLKISSSNSKIVLLDMDGEDAGELPISIEVIPRALKILAPWKEHFK